MTKTNPDKLCKSCREFDRHINGTEGSCNDVWVECKCEDDDMTWISVKKELPTKKHKYIACLINGKPIACQVHDATLNLTLMSVSFYWPTKQWIKDDLYGEITHWMDLPEIPKEG